MERLGQDSRVLKSSKIAQSREVLCDDVCRTFPFPLHLSNIRRRVTFITPSATAAASSPLTRQAASLWKGRYALLK